MVSGKNQLTKRIAQSLTWSASYQGSSSTRTKNVYCATENRVLERDANRFWNRIHQIMTDSMTGDCPQENFFSLLCLPMMFIYLTPEMKVHTPEKAMSLRTLFLSQLMNNAENEEYFSVTRTDDPTCHCTHCNTVRKLE